MAGLYRTKTPFELEMEQWKREMQIQEEQAKKDQQKPAPETNKKNSEKNRKDNNPPKKKSNVRAVLKKAFAEKSATDKASPKKDSKPMSEMDKKKFNAGLKSGAAPADTIIKEKGNSGQTLSAWHDERPIPESNAEGIGRAENDMGKEATKPKQRNQMDETQEGRPGGSYGNKPKQRNQMDETQEGRPGGTYGNKSGNTPSAPDDIQEFVKYATGLDRSKIQNLPYIVKRTKERNTVGSTPIKDKLSEKVKRTARNFGTRADHYAISADGKPAEPSGTVSRSTTGSGRTTSMSNRSGTATQRGIQSNVQNGLKESPSSATVHKYGTGTGNKSSANASRTNSIRRAFQEEENKKNSRTGIRR